MSDLLKDGLRYIDQAREEEDGNKEAADFHYRAGLAKFREFITTSCGGDPEELDRLKHSISHFQTKMETLGMELGIPLKPIPVVYPSAHPIPARAPATPSCQPPQRAGPSTSHFTFQRDSAPELRQIQEHNRRVAEDERRLTLHAQKLKLDYEFQRASELRRIEDVRREADRRRDEEAKKAEDMRREENRQRNEERRRQEDLERSRLEDENMKEVNEGLKRLCDHWDDKDKRLKERKAAANERRADKEADRQALRRRL